MLYATLLVAAASISGLVAAQNSSTNLPAGIQPCCNVDANVVPQNLKDSWCQAQENTCPDLCGGVGQFERDRGSTCDEETLQFTCKCSNGTEPRMDLYQQSVPGQMCRFWFELCINATGTNRVQQQECKNFGDACGNLTVSDAGEIRDGDSELTTSSAGPSSTSSGSNAPTSSGSDAAGSSPTGAAPGLVLARDYGTPLLAGGIAAIFGLAL